MAVYDVSEMSWDEINNEIPRRNIEIKEVSDRGEFAMKHDNALTETEKWKAFLKAVLFYSKKEPDGLHESLRDKINVFRSTHDAVADVLIVYNFVLHVELEPLIALRCTLR